MGQNDRRADHQVNDIYGMGYNVRLYYRGYEVSLAADGESSRVYPSKESSDTLFESPTTTGESVLQCFQFIDELVLTSALKPANQVIDESVGDYGGDY